MIHRISTLDPTELPRACGVVLALVVGFGLVLLCANGRADETSASAELELVRARIAELSANLGQSQLRRDALAGELRRTEEQIAQTSRAIATLDGAIAAGKARLDEIRLRSEAAERRLAHERSLLADQLRARYMLVRQDYLKVLLNQQDPASLGRGLRYHAYLTRAHADRVRGVTTELVELEALGAEAASEASALETLYARRLEAKTALETNREQREQALAAMHEGIAQKGTRLEELKSNERDLVELVRKLERTLAETPAVSAPQASFASVEGELAWPAGGRIRHAFGTPVNGGDLSWQGVLIGSPAGEPVRAIWDGTVVFADWLKGFGLLLIINHGETYMSLYGHNEALHKDVGDVVRAGEVLATVGNSGGQLATGLYFEIRHHGIPQNPGRWCAHPPQNAPAVLVSG